MVSNTLPPQVLKTPQFMSITFNNDPLATSLDNFVATVGATAYWTATTAEYGVGPGSAVTPVHLTEVLPATIDDSNGAGSVQAWLKAKLAGTALGVPNSNMIYVIFYPAGVAVTYGGGGSCSTFGAYHGSVTLPGGKNVAYAVVPRCNNPLFQNNALQTATASTSHELIEAATDPFQDNPPVSYAAFQHVDFEHIVWELVLLGETGDLCAQDPSSFYIPAGYNYVVQRSWSNSAALAGKDFCQPSLPGQVYFQSVPVMNDPVSFSYGGMPITGVLTKGVHIPIGTSKTIDVALYSEAPLSQWTVAAQAVTPGTLTFAWNKTTGVNGEVLKLTITSVAKDNQFGGAPFFVISGRGQVQRFYVGFVN